MASSQFISFGNQTVAGNITVPGTVAADSVVLDAANQDCIAVRDAANTWGFRNAGNPQMLDVYNQFTSAANFERLSVGFVGNAAVLNTNNTGGTARPFIIQINGNAVCTVNNTGTAMTCTANVESPFFKTTTALIAAGGGSGNPALTASSTGGTNQPATAAQNGWIKALDSTGATIWIPVWK